MLNGCISALWDDVRRELDGNVIPGIGPPSVFQEVSRAGRRLLPHWSCRMVTSCVFASRMFNAYP